VREERGERRRREKLMMLKKRIKESTFVGTKNKSVVFESGMPLVVIIIPNPKET